tara:strand:- start:180 stop:3164 length:2985 start_codon:yes stop_codon:yes gene_type:complete
MCDLPDTGLPIIDDAFDIIEDVFEGIIDIVEDIVSWLMPIPELPDFDDGFNDPTSRTDGILVNKQSSSSGLPLIYGMRKVGGIMAFVQTDSTNEFLYVALAMCEGKIHACKKIFFDDVEVTDFNTSDSSGSTSPSSFTDQTVYYGKFADVQNDDGTTTNQSHVQMQFFDGDDDQVASSILSTLSDWTSNHRLRGVSYLALKLRFNPDVFSRVPRINALIQGRKISTFDSSSNETTDQYSTNPAFVMLDYLTNTRFGKGVPIANIDIPSFYTASQVAETDITPTGSAVTNPQDNSSGNTINLLDMNIALDTRNKVLNNIRELVLSCRGLLSYAGGKYKLTIESTGSSVLTLDESDIIGGINIQSESKTDKYNKVLIDFPDIDLGFKNNTASFPPNDDSGLASADQHATMKTADGGELLEGRFTLQGLTSFHQAQEHAEVILRRSRNGLRVSLKASGEAMNLIVGDIVSITHATPSFSAKVFRVIGVTLNKDQTVNLNLVEHQDSFYTFATQSAVATIPDTTLPNPLTISAPASVTLSDELVEYSEGTVITRLNILVGASTDKFVREYQVEAKKSTESNFKIIGRGIQLNYELLNVIDDATYNVRVRAVNNLGVASAYTTADRKIVGATEPPSDVTNFSVNMLGSSQMQLNWDANTDLDISFYEIRYQNVTNNAQWNKSVNWLQVPRTSGTSITTNVRDGAFCIKAVDKLGNESNNETIIYSNIASATNNFKDIQTLTEDITAGTFDGDVALTDSSGTTSIVLDTLNNFDDVTGNFDDASGDFDLGGANDNVDNEGFYTLAQTLSLTGIFDVSFIKSITIDQIEDPYDLFDDGRGAALFDDAPAPFDGNDPTNATVQLQIATSTTSLDNATSFQPMNTSTTFKGRYFKFRLRLANKNFKTRAFVSGISIDVKMQKRQETGEDVASGTSTKSVAFTSPFFAIPSIGIAAQNMATGDFFTISNKAITGFDIDFKNSSGTNINRTFDFVAVGHGLKSSS